MIRLLIKCFISSLLLRIRASKWVLYSPEGMRIGNNFYKPATRRADTLPPSTPAPQLWAFVKPGQDTQKLQKLLNFSSSLKRAQMGIVFIFSVSKISEIRFNSKPDKHSSSALMFFHDCCRVAVL